MGSPARFRRRGSRPTLWRRSVLPRLEVLEDRTVPSTLTVRNNHDSGAGSLRATLAVAVSGDTIVFANSLNHQTITLTSGALPIPTNLDIEGLGADKLTVSGHDSSRVFDISGSASVSIAGLTITDGLATSGGGILVEGSAALSISKCTLTDNVALGTLTGSLTVPDGDGGGIEDNSSGALTVANCTFDANKAIARGPNAPPPAGSNYIIALGGAIDVSFFSTGPATISNSTFTGNQALGGVPGASAGGGALSNSSLTFGTAANMTVTGCTLSGNAAIGAAGGDGVSNFGSG
jgi:Right handed beta helix region